MSTIPIEMPRESNNDMWVATFSVTGAAVFARWHTSTHKRGLKMASAFLRNLRNISLAQRISWELQ